MSTLDDKLDAIERHATATDKTHMANNWNAALVRDYCPTERTEPLTMSLKVYFNKSARGDADNYAGAVMDACQRYKTEEGYTVPGVLFKDDKQIKELHIELFEHHGQNMVEIELSKYSVEAE